jgi:uncharacterized DUF497 family protein
MLLEFDRAKSAKNVRERGIGFERFAELELETAISTDDTRPGSRGTADACARAHRWRAPRRGGDAAR